MSPEVAELNAVAETLPPAIVRHLAEYAKRFQGPYWTWPGYSDEWTDEDMRDFSNAAIAYFEELHPDEDWGDLKLMNPGEKYK